VLVRMLARGVDGTPVGLYAITIWGPCVDGASRSRSIRLRHGASAFRTVRRC